MGVIKGDTRRLDYSSDDGKELKEGRTKMIAKDDNNSRPQVQRRLEFVGWKLQGFRAVASCTAGETPSKTPSPAN